MKGPIAKIALIGARAVGKSTLGRRLAERLGWPFTDTDDEIAAQVGRAAGDFLAERGEAEFREIERQVVGGVLARSGRAVVALGGGSVIIPSVAAALRASGVLVVWLQAPAAVLVERQRYASVRRPSLTGSSLEAEVSTLLERRQAACDGLASIRLETFPANVDACCTDLLATIEPLLTEP